jgi:hypothetical protein
MIGFRFTRGKPESHASQDRQFEMKLPALLLCEAQALSKSESGRHRSQILRDL